MDFLPLKTLHWAFNASVTLLNSGVSVAHSYSQAKPVSKSKVTVSASKDSLKVGIPPSSLLSTDTEAHSRLHSLVRPKDGIVNQRSYPREHEEEQVSQQVSSRPLSHHPPKTAELREI